MAAAEGGVSAGTQAVLGAFGLSIGTVVLYVAWLVVRAVAGVLGSRPPAAQRAGKQQAPAAAAAQQPQQHRAGAGAKQPNLKELIKQSKNAKKSAVTKEDLAAHHALFLSTLRGHGDAITGIAWSPGGRLVATACEDMHVRLFDLSKCLSAAAASAASGSSNKDPGFKHHELRNTPLGVGFGNDGHSLVVCLRGYPDIRLAQLSPHKGAKAGAVSWATDWEKGEVLGSQQLLGMVVVPSQQAQALGQATGGGVAVLLSEKKEGRVFGLASGAQLAEFAPNSFQNHGLAVSADGRFIAVPSFTAEVKVWEVSWGRTGYSGCKKVMDLKGHSSQVMSAAFAPDGSRAVTASKDGTLRIWNTAVRYQLQEDPKTLLKVDLPLPAGQVFELLAWGPDGTIAASLGQHIHFIDSKTGQVLEVLHAHEGTISQLVWSPKCVSLGGEEPEAVLASSSADRRVRIWRSPKAQQ